MTADCCIFNVFSSNCLVGHGAHLFTFSQLFQDGGHVFLNPRLFCGLRVSFLDLLLNRRNARLNLRQMLAGPFLPELVQRRFRKSSMHVHEIVRYAGRPSRSLADSRSFL